MVGKLRLDWSGKIVVASSIIGANTFFTSNTVNIMSASS